MALGLCCQWMAPTRKDPDKYENILCSRNLQLTRFNKGLYSADKIKNTYLDNLKNLREVLPLVRDGGIRVFRISSSMFPLYDKVPKNYWDNEDVHKLLQNIGLFLKQNGIRATTHPGQFCVLSSDEDSKRDNAIKEIEHHAWMMDQMGLDQTPYYSINIHGGKSDRPKQLIEGISLLSDSARNRLTLENCEFAYSVAELLAVSKATGVPICFDSHHHSFRTGSLSASEALEAARGTWAPGIRPMTHLSNSKPEYRHSEAVSTKARSHSDYIDYVPECQQKANNRGEIDIDIEAKMKNLAIFDVISKLNLKLA